eukprot:14179137-Ditylum_brightwellii.AAC.1
MPESESAKDDDKSSTDLSVDDPWKGYTMQRITNVSKDLFGSHWVVSCAMYDADDELTRDYADEHEEVLSFYYEIEVAVLE